MRTDTWAAIGGIVFAVLFVFGMLAPMIPVGGEASADEEVRAFYADDGNLSRVVFATYALGLAGLGFAGFLAGLYRRLRASDVDRLLPYVAMIAGILWLAMLFAGGAAQGALAGAMLLGGEPRTLEDTGVARFLAHTGYAMVLIFGALAAALMVLAASVVGQRTGALPQWLNWLGYLTALALLAGIIFLPVLALPLWVAAASVVLLRPGVAPRAA